MGPPAGGPPADEGVGEAILAMALAVTLLPIALELAGAPAVVQ